MALPIKNTNQIDMPWTAWYFYGESGCGKTTAASTFPEPLFLVPSNEKSYVTLMGRGIDYVEIFGQKGDGRYMGLEPVVSELEREYYANPTSFRYETIVVESLTHYGEQLQEELTDGNKRQMDQQRWGLFGAHLRNIHSRLRNMDVHIVYTCLVKEPDNADIVAVPMMQGRSAVVIPSACDVIGYCTHTAGKPPVYEIHFQKYRGRYPARTRFSRMPPKVVNFNFAEMEPYLSVQQ